MWSERCNLNEKCYDARCKFIGWLKRIIIERRDVLVWKERVFNHQEEKIDIKKQE